MRLLVLTALLAGVPSPDICEALNVTVSPGPRVQYVVGDNATLFCHVSQKRRIENLLAVRWVFALPPTQEYLMIKMTKFGVVQYYGNYTRLFHRQRLRLLEERHRTMYTFLILNLQQADQGHYICKVQEIGKHRNKWTAWSNGSASTEIQVTSSKVSDGSSAEKNHNAWKFFEVWGQSPSACYPLLKMLFFLGLPRSKRLILLYFPFRPVCLCCVRVLHRHSQCFAFHSCHPLPDFGQQETIPCKALLGEVFPEQRMTLLGLGETVTSVTNVSAVQPIKIKKKKKTEQPPAVPAKAPISNTFSKPKLLKPQRKVLLPKIAEENLTYAELELIKPHQEAKGIPTMTVYAQILFEENKM
ncbi:hypothetical protein lerEdw1_013272 [Lerista edwardsae]|nr:hypothetical protein lerEdw1_013272 [Lerista edwardsae]